MPGPPLPTPAAKYAEAKKRADRLPPIFPAGNPAVMNAVISALEQEEKHVASPTTVDSGKAQFFDALWPVLAPTFPAGTANAEIAAFIADLWNATWASRRAQEYKPCW